MAYFSTEIAHLHKKRHTNMNECMALAQFNKKQTSGGILRVKNYILFLLELLPVTHLLHEVTRIIWHTKRSEDGMRLL